MRVLLLIVVAFAVLMSIKAVGIAIDRPSPDTDSVATWTLIATAIIIIGAIAKPIWQFSSRAVREFLQRQRLPSQPD